MNEERVTGLASALLSRSEVVLSRPVTWDHPPVRLTARMSVIYRDQMEVVFEQFTRKRMLLPLQHLQVFRPEEVSSFVHSALASSVPNLFPQPVWNDLSIVRSTVIDRDFSFLKTWESRLNDVELTGTGEGMASSSE